jgi:hypothetical protein
VGAADETSEEALMQMSEETRQTTNEGPLSELRKRSLVLEDERARLVAMEEPRLARVIRAIDEEYAELYEAIETLLSASPCVAQTPVVPAAMLEPTTVDEDDLMPKRRASVCLSAFVTIGVAVLGLAALMSTSGDAAPTKPLAPETVVIRAADVPEDTQAPMGASSFDDDDALGIISPPSKHDSARSKRRRAKAVAARVDIKKRPSS